MRKRECEGMGEGVMSEVVGGGRVEGGISERESVWVSKHVSKCVND